MAVVERVSHRVAVMYLGEIVEISPRSAVFENPVHPYTRRLLAAVPVPDPRQRHMAKKLAATEIKRSGAITRLRAAQTHLSGGLARSLGPGMGRGVGARVTQPLIAVGGASVKSADDKLAMAELATRARSDD